MTRTPEGVRRLASGRYQARYAVGSRMVSAGTYATIAEAKKARAAEMAKLDSGRGWVDPAHRKITVAEWAEQWYALRRAPNRKVRSFLDAQIVPRWGRLALKDVATIDVQQWINDLSATLSPATVRGLHATLRQMLGKAVDYDLLGVNPVRGIELPREAEPDVVPLSVEQMMAMEANAPVRFRAMIHLGCWAGLRWGELAALRWDDVDLEAGVITVSRSMGQCGTKIGPTKNGKTRRIPMTARTVEVLRAHRRDFGSTELLFTTARQSRPLSGSNWRKSPWATIVKGMTPTPTCHDMRHGFAAHMVRQGVDWKVLADLMGHHKPSFTMDRYGWVRQDRNDVAVAALERAMAL